jgi:SAM-dependent methyltransferase
VNRLRQPDPWAEGDNIPWNDPSFSKRMLEEHLSQTHDAASRRFEKIDHHVEWIHHELLYEQPSRILDLACGPGLYAQRLAALGHECTGIDFSPASIAYAREEAQRNQLAIHYQQHDLRTAGFPDGQDLAMLISGEVNVFSPWDAKRIVKKAAESLTKSGQLVLEVHASGVIPRRGQEPRTWYASKSGLWSDSPHICLQENFWDPDRKAATTRYFVTDAATGETTMSSASYQDYSDDEYESLLIESGFRSVTRFSSLTGVTDDYQKDFMVLVASK